MFAGLTLADVTEHYAKEEAGFRASSVEASRARGRVASLPSRAHGLRPKFSLSRQRSRQRADATLVHALCVCTCIRVYGRPSEPRARDEYPERFFC